MAHYTIALVQHGTSLSTEQLDNTCRELQAFYTAVFEGTSDRLTVQWRTGTSDHNIVIHFAQDVASSYLHCECPAGHSVVASPATHESETERCARRSTGTSSGAQSSSLVRTPGRGSPFTNPCTTWNRTRQKNKIGATGGLGATPIGRSLTDGNKEWIRTKIRTKRTQQL